MLDLIGLTRRYGEVVALDELTFTVPAGRVFGVLEPNGAGKTTAMRAVFDLVKLDAGEVRWRGEPIGERERRGFGYMPEERGLYPGMRVLEQLVFLGRLHGLRAVQADEPRRTGPSASGSPIVAATSSSRSRSATSSACSSRRHSSTRQICWSSTSPSPGSTRWRSTR